MSMAVRKATNGATDIITLFQGEAPSWNLDPQRNFSWIQLESLLCARAKHLLCGSVISCIRLLNNHLMKGLVMESRLQSSDALPACP